MFCENCACIFQTLFYSYALVINETPALVCNYFAGPAAKISGEQYVKTVERFSTGVSSKVAIFCLKHSKCNFKIYKMCELSFMTSRELTTFLLAYLKTYHKYWD